MRFLNLSLLIFLSLRIACVGLTASQVIQEEIKDKKLINTEIDNEEMNGVIKNEIEQNKKADSKYKIVN